jgi:glucose-6-phosphate dehydrogenase assembly protein OpcA
MWATADESSAQILELYDFAAAHSDETIDALELTDTGSVPWWPAERATVTLQQILIHVAVEFARHAGHADIVRELIDGTAGDDAGNLPDQSPGEWQEYRALLERTADEAETRWPNRIG